MSARRPPSSKIKLQPRPLTPEAKARLAAWATAAVYTGNPHHKRRPGDYGLTPPCDPRTYKSLCDNTGIFKREKAEKLLKEGFLRGLICTQEVDGWPTRVWAVTDGGVAIEAMFEKHTNGQYHGYPLDADSALADEVFERWASP